LKSLVNTKTRENLLKSFAGESQASNRYDFYARVARTDGFIQISRIFEETANHERLHARRFFNFLVEGLKEELPTVVEISAGYPVAKGDTLKNLKAAAAGEKEEWHDLYPDFAKIAKGRRLSRDFIRPFLNIAEAEKRHETRFIKLADNVRNDRVFKRQEPVEWTVTCVAILILELHHQRPVPPASTPRPTLSYLRKTIT